MTRLIYGLSFFLSVFLFSSCIDGEEEIFLQNNGSARLKMKYEIPEMLLSEAEVEKLKRSIAEKVNSKKGFKLIQNEVTKQHGKKIIKIEIAISDILDLKDLLNEDTGDLGSNKQVKSHELLDSLLGEVNFKLNGLTASVRREIDLSPMLEEKFGKNSLALLGESEFRYTLHLPKAVKETNAHKVSDGGKTLKWSYKLREINVKPMTMKLVAPISLPYWIYLCVGGVATLAIVLFVFIYKKRKKVIKKVA